jgi:hypothetical protein
MLNGFASLQLRPIRFAFAVDPYDIDSVIEAVEINTFLWGGTFNPLIPTFNKIPSERKKSDGVTSAELFAGYLEAFDPDYVVVSTKLTRKPIRSGGRKIIHSSELLSGTNKSGIPNYGTGLFEIFAHLEGEEFKFVRKQPLKIHVPVPENSYRQFLSTVFGSLSPHHNALFLANYEKEIDVEKTNCSIENYAEIISQRNTFIRHVTGAYHVEIRNAQYPLYSGCIFLLDASKAIDLIDYWNLRAAGWRVIPVPKQAANLENVKQLITGFVENNYFPHKFKPEVYHSTVLLKSRSVGEPEFRDFFDGFSTLNTDVPNKPKIVRLGLYPRIWDNWARQGDGIKPCRLDAGSITRDFSANENELVRVRTLDPEFLNKFSFPGSNPRFANEMNLNVFGEKEPYAEVIPEGNEFLNEAFGSLHIGNLRFSKTGIVFLSEYLEKSIHMHLPKAEPVFAAWLKARGWLPKISDKGRIAKQMLKQIGGEWGIRPLENEGVIRLLQSASEGKTLKEATLRAETSRIAKQWGNPDPSGLIRLFTSHGIFQLGMEFQCPICTQHSWYSIKEADYELQCMKCLEHFQIPTHSSKEIKWSYRSLGPFSLPNYAFGAYSVLFTLSFFGKASREKKTAYFSFTAKKQNKQIEVDLGLLLRESGLTEGEPRPVFAECKTFNYFKKPDIARMRLIGTEFPNSILLFATIRSDLTVTEKKLLSGLVHRNRKLGEAGRSFNPVMILTATELLSAFGPPLCWKELKSANELSNRYYAMGSLLLNVCDITQQLYLDLQPWDGLPGARW